MSQFDLPKRWAQKIDIYQQIRSGTGISKHKDLWRYERNYLLWAYGPNHQHLNSWLAFIGFQKNASSDQNTSLEEGKAVQAIGNLLMKGFITIKSKEDNLKNKFDSPDHVISQDVKVRTTLNGLLVGEVLDESKHFWGKYKYEFFLNLIWVILWGAVFLVLREFVNWELILTQVWVEYPNSIVIGFLILWAIIWPAFNTIWLLWREYKS